MTCYYKINRDTKEYNATQYYTIKHFHPVSMFVVNKNTN